jgi:hypothetical protein
LAFKWDKSVFKCSNIGEMGYAQEAWKSNGFLSVAENEGRGEVKCQKFDVLTPATWAWLLTNQGAACVIVIMWRI